MRRGFGIAAVVVVVILGGLAVAAGAFRAGQREGYDRGIERVEQIQQTQEGGGTVEVVRVMDDKYGPGFRGGFFPFGFLFFPLFLIGIVFLVRGLFWRGRGWGPGGGPGWGPGHGPWGPDAKERFESKAGEWHRRQHGGDAPPGEQPATA